jgi:hypothetical protein
MPKSAGESSARATSIETGIETPARRGVPITPSDQIPSLYNRAMGEPFRDEVSAALARVETLEDENEELREEVERLRAAASNSGSADLAAQATRVLEKLDALSERRPRVAADRVPEVRAPSEERGELEMTAKRTLEQPAIKPSMPPLSPEPAKKARAKAIAWLCVACFFAGMIAHACIAAALR